MTPKTNVKLFQMSHKDEEDPVDELGDKQEVVIT